MSDNLTMQELTAAVAAATEWSKTLTHIFIKEMFAVIAEGLERDGEVKLGGLGGFRLRWVEPRMGRNPQTGEPLLIPGYRKVLFRPEKSLRELVNRRYAHLKPVFLKETPVPATLLLPEPTPEQSEPVHQPPLENREMESRRIDKNNRMRWAAVFILPVLLLALWLLLKPRKELPAEPVAAPPAAAEIKSIDTKPAESTLTSPADAHLVKPGDTLWEIAGEFYDENLFWPLIYRSNQQTLADPDRLEPQQMLTLEQLQGSRLHLSRSDSARLSEGYHLVYLAYKEKSKADADDFQRVAVSYGQNINR